MADAEKKEGTQPLASAPKQETGRLGAGQLESEGFSEAPVEAPPKFERLAEEAIKAPADANTAAEQQAAGAFERVQGATQELGGKDGVEIGAFKRDVQAANEALTEGVRQEGGVLEQVVQETAEETTASIRTASEDEGSRTDKRYALGISPGGTFRLGDAEYTVDAIENGTVFYNDGRGGRHTLSEKALAEVFERENERKAQELQELKEQVAKEAPERARQEELRTAQETARNARRMLPEKLAGILGALQVSMGDKLVVSIEGQEGKYAFGGFNEEGRAILIPPVGNIIVVLPGAIESARKEETPQQPEARQELPASPWLDTWRPRFFNEVFGFPLERQLTETGDALAQIGQDIQVYEAQLGEIPTRVSLEQNQFRNDMLGRLDLLRGDEGLLKGRLVELEQQRAKTGSLADAQERKATGEILGKSLDDMRRDRARTQEVYTGKEVVMRDGKRCIVYGFDNAKIDADGPYVILAEADANGQLRRVGSFPRGEVVGLEVSTGERQQRAAEQRGMREREGAIDLELPPSQWARDRKDFFQRLTDLEKIGGAANPFEAQGDAPESKAQRRVGDIEAELEPLYELKRDLDKVPPEKRTRVHEKLQRDANERIEQWEKDAEKLAAMVDHRQKWWGRMFKGIVARSWERQRGGKGVIGRPLKFLKALFWELPKGGFKVAGEVVKGIGQAEKFRKGTKERAIDFAAFLNDRLENIEGLSNQLRADEYDRRKENNDKLRQQIRDEALHHLQKLLHETGVQLPGESLNTESERVRNMLAEFDARVDNLIKAGEEVTEKQVRKFFRGLLPMWRGSYALGRRHKHVPTPQELQEAGELRSGDVPARPERPEQVERKRDRKGDKEGKKDKRGGNARGNNQGGGREPQAVAPAPSRVEAAAIAGGGRNLSPEDVDAIARAVDKRQKKQGKGGGGKGNKRK